MTPIPEELLEQFERGNALLFIGERIVRDAAGQAVMDRLTAQLAARCDVVDEGRLTFPEAAQAYQDEKGRQALVLFLRDQLEELGDEPQRAHRLIARLTDCGVLVTTCIDRRLERAFAEAERPLDVIVGNVDVAFEDTRKAQLYKLRGSVEQPESLVLTEDDDDAFFQDQASISVVLQGYLARKTILFVGYDLADPHFRQLYRKVTVLLDDYARRAYAFGEAPPPKVCRWCERHSVEVIATDTTAFLEALSEQLAARAQPAPAISLRPIEEPAAPLPERPYKLLDYYEAKDASLFFGRGKETQTLASLIHAHRLVLLNGASGVGKTSLLLAGAVPQLVHAEPPYETLYVRALEDPALVIRRALRRRLPDAGLPEEGSLLDFLAAATRALGRTLVILLDQFEEFFIRPSPQFRAAFIAELGALHDAHDVPVKVVLSLREDWLASMSELEERIPEVFRTRMRLLPLTRDQARQAITAPVEQLRVSYEPALVERLLDDLAGSKGVAVMPPQLQLVCNALYEGLGSEERTIFLAAYERLGGARGVLQQYLDDELARLESDERALAHGLLEELVTSQGTKAVKAVNDLALALDAELANVGPVLEKLVRARLLRALEREDGETAYELAHEYLIREIGLGAEAKARKQAEELIQQEVENWRRFDTLLAADKLALISEVREELRLNAEAQELLLRSALQVGHDVAYWLNRMRDPERQIDVLIETAGSKLAVVQQRAAEALGTRDVPQAVEPLLALAMHDADPSVRQAARQSLSELSEQRPMVVMRLRSEMEHADRAVRRYALETLAALPLRGLSAALRLRVLATRTRLQAARWGEQILRTPRRRAAALTVALILLLIGVVYAFSASCYYVDTRPSPIPGEPNVVIIRRGHPLLKLPGLDRELVDTAVDLSQVSDRYWEDVNSERLWGLWAQRSSGGYQKWSEDVFTALDWKHGVQMLWYLNPNQGLEAISRAARSKDLRTRRRGVNALEQVAVADSKLVPQVTEAMAELLTDEDWGVRHDAADATGFVASIRPDFVDGQVVKALAELLSDEYGDVRASAAQTLGGLVAIRPDLVDPQLADSLVEMLGDENVEARGSAADSLARFSVVYPEVAVPRVAASLVEHLADENGYVRSMVVKALGQVAATNPEWVTPEVIGALVEQLGDEDWNVRVGAAEALGKMGTANPEVVDALVRMLRHENLDARIRAVDALGKVGAANPEWVTSEVIDTLVRLLWLSRGDPNARRTAADALGQMAGANREVIDALVEQLGDKDRNVRYIAAYVLGQVGTAHPEWVTSEVIDALVERLGDEDWNVRVSATDALGQVGAGNPRVVTSEAIDALLGLLSDEYSEVRFSAADALGQVGTVHPEWVTSEVIDALVERMSDEDMNVRIAAAYVLGQVGTAHPEWVTSEVIDALVERMSDEVWNMRGTAADTLGQMAMANPEVVTLQVIDALVGLLGDEDRFVRIDAADALGKMAAANPEVVTPQVVDALVGLLSHQDQNARRTAADALGKMAAPNPEVVTSQVVDALVKLLSHQDRNARAGAADALGQVGTANPELVTPQMVDTLAGLLSDKDRFVRADAAAALVSVYVYGRQAPQPGERDDLLFARLTDPLNALERRVAARALFLVALHDSSHGRVIRNRLEILSASSRPIERIWANTSLQMIDLADQAHHAMNTLSQREEIENKLARLQYADLFGQDFTWATQEALGWLKQQTIEDRTPIAHLPARRRRYAAKHQSGGESR